MCALSQSLDISQNVTHKFTEPSMEQPCSCSCVVHQYGGQKIVSTSGTYFGYLGH